MYLLDTDHLSILQRRTSQGCDSLRRRLIRLPKEAIHARIVSFHEQINGWNSFLNGATTHEQVCHAYEMLGDALRHYGKMRILPFDDNAAQVFGRLHQQRIRVQTLDLRIASIALSRDMTLLTRNSVDFSRVPGLKFEDWTVDSTGNGSH